MLIKPSSSEPRPRRAIGPGETAAIILVLGLAVFAILFAPTPASGEGYSERIIAQVYRTMVQLVELVR
ncbi:MAG: hypothetical protein KJP11_05595 [Gammaproteobacteria bacterium]|nr:hypothetical protein [Gammaproteobacteria bacterium]